MQLDNLKFYRTDSCLSYGESVILLKISNEDFLVVELNADEEYCSYKIGETEKFSEKDQPVYLEKIDYDLKYSPLSGTFLFESFLKSL